MIYFKDAYVTVWEVDEKEKFAVVSMSSSRKDKNTDKWLNSNWKFARFVGEAFKKCGDLSPKDRIMISGGFSWEPYEQDGERKWAKTPSIVVWNFSRPKRTQDPDRPPEVEEIDDEEESNPFEFDDSDDEVPF